MIALYTMRYLNRATLFRTLVYGSLAVIALAGLAAWYLATAYQPAPNELRLSGDATTVGRLQGKMSGTGLSLICRFYLKDGLCASQDAVYHERGALAWAAMDTGSVYATELQALAAAAELPVESVAYGNSFLDLGSARAGCRSVVVTTPHGLLHGHNLDWDDLAGLARWSVSVIRRQPTDGRFATVAIGFPGQIGALDIINEHGVALSFNQLGRGNRAVPEPVWIALRRIAETCHDFPDARAAILDLPPGMPFLITLSDAQSGRAAVYERAGIDAPIVERLPHDGRIAANNSAKDHGALATTFDRAVRAHPASVDGVQAALRDPIVLLPNNLYSVIWDYHHNRFHLASGTIPAAAAEYREFVMFD